MGATGTAEENNARVIREHRFAFADVGDESSSCESTTPPPTTAPPAPTSAPLGELKSPNFPSAYTNNLDTTQTIEVAEGQKVNIKFSHLDIESHSSCAYDYITVIDGDGTVLLAKTCGGTLPTEFQSKTSWRLTYTLVPMTGEVTSPNYPEITITTWTR